MKCRLSTPRTANCTIGEMFMGKSTLIWTTYPIYQLQRPKNGVQKATCILYIAQMKRNAKQIWNSNFIHICTHLHDYKASTIKHKTGSPTNTNILAEFVLDYINKDHDKLDLQGLIICFLLSARHSLVIQEGVTIHNWRRHNITKMSQSRS